MRRQGTPNCRRERGRAGFDYPVPSAPPDGPRTGALRVFTKGNFELLGAAIGDDTFCEKYMAERVAQCDKLLGEPKAFDDPQVALRLLRACAGVCKVMQSMRMTPPKLHANALSDFDGRVRETFCHIIGAMPNNEQWEQATCGLACAGLGLRQASLHAPAAFLSSICDSRERCHSLDDDFSLRADDPSSFTGEALTLHNSALPECDQLSPENLPSAKQRELSAALDKACFLRRHAAECPANKAALLSEREKGARKVWQAVPHRSKGTAIPAEEFQAEVRYRLCMPDREESTFCPLCDDTMDQFGHHCRKCSAGGDRTIWHNGVRNIIFNLCCRPTTRN